MQLHYKMDVANNYTTIVFIFNRKTVSFCAVLFCMLNKQACRMAINIKNYELRPVSKNRNKIVVFDAQHILEQFTPVNTRGC